MPNCATQLCVERSEETSFRENPSAVEALASSRSSIQAEVSTSEEVRARTERLCEQHARKHAGLLEQATSM